MERLHPVMSWVCKKFNIKFLSRITKIRTHLCELDFAVGLEENPSNAHSNEVRSDSGPWFVVDFVEQGEGIVGVWHVVVGVSDDA